MKGFLSAGSEIVQGGKRLHYRNQANFCQTMDDGR
jgi:hypothetical protein